MPYIKIIFLSFVSAIAVYGQQAKISGKVLDKNSTPVAGATIILPSGNYAISDNHGHFTVLKKTLNDTILSISHLGFKQSVITLTEFKQAGKTIVLKPKLQTLQEVVVHDSYAEHRKKETSLNMEVVNHKYLKKHLGGSLMHTLDRMPGIGAMEMGAGQSKPVIRGLGFNRVAIVENGIKHEGQQWGADHGLEMDQFAIDRIEIIKGPASLQYGSDAIGGVIELKQAMVPEKYTAGGTIDITGKSNNKLFGSSVKIYGRRDKIYAAARFTYINYADFKVPANYLSLYDWQVPLNNGKVRNTAGNELNLHGLLGYTTNKFSWQLKVSHIDMKTGFFANAGGLEPLTADTKLHDKSDRDILLPYQEVEHLKISNTSRYHIHNKLKLKVELAYQNNFRQEWNTYSPHGDELLFFPDTLGFAEQLEKEMNKHTLSGKVTITYLAFSNWSLQTGISGQYQKNDISGRTFLTPSFQRKEAGIFNIAKYHIGQSLLFAGIRYDFTNLQTNRYFEWYPPYKQKGFKSNQNFSNLSWSVGHVFNREHITFKTNLGKSFRAPLAKEIGANGINWHTFRYEIGDSLLSPEQSYQLDMGLEWHHQFFAVGISPFVNYFQNYLYLNPTQYYYEGTRLQKYLYSETEVFRFGGEFHTHYNPIEKLRLGIIAEYVYSRQISAGKKGYNLPFAPPPEFTFNTAYQFKNTNYFAESYISIDLFWALEQNNVVPPEETTPAYTLVNISAGTIVQLANVKAQFNIQVNNLLNKKYYKHNSFYRQIDMPQPGRNISMNISIPFTHFFKPLNN